MADPFAAPSVIGVAPVIQRTLEVSFSGESTYTQGQGVTPDYESVRNVTLQEGEFVADVPKVEAHGYVSTRKAVYAVKPTAPAAPAAHGVAWPTGKSPAQTAAGLPRYARRRGNTPGPAPPILRPG
jgi:ribosomal protein L10